jgi:hypothetical protein
MGGGGLLNRNYRLSEAEARLINVGKFSQYLQENTTLCHYNDNLLTLFREINSIYTEKRTRPTNAKLHGY